MSVKNCEDFLNYANTILENTDDVFVKDAMTQLQASLVTGPVTARGLDNIERARNVIQTYLEYEMIKSDPSKINYVQKVKSYMDGVGYRSDYQSLWQYVQTLAPGQINGIDTPEMVDMLKDVANKQLYSLYQYTKSNEKNLLELFANKTEYRDFVKNIANEDGAGEIKNFQKRFDEYIKEGNDVKNTLEKMFYKDETIEPEVLDAFLSSPDTSTFTDIMIFKYIVSDTATFTKAISLINGLEASSPKPQNFINYLGKGQNVENVVKRIKKLDPAKYSLSQDFLRLHNSLMAKYGKGLSLELADRDWVNLLSQNSYDRVIHGEKMLGRYEHLLFSLNSLDEQSIKSLAQNIIEDEVDGMLKNILVKYSEKDSYGITKLIYNNKAKNGWFNLDKWGDAIAEAKRLGIDERAIEELGSIENSIRQISPFINSKIGVFDIEKITKFANDNIERVTRNIEIEKYYKGEEVAKNVAGQYASDGFYGEGKPAIRLYGAYNDRTLLHEVGHHLENYLNESDVSDIKIHYEEQVKAKAQEIYNKYKKTKDFNGNIAPSINGKGFVDRTNVLLQDVIDFMQGKEIPNNIRQNILELTKGDDLYRYTNVSEFFTEELADAFERGSAPKGILKKFYEFLKKLAGNKDAFFNDVARGFDTGKYIEGTYGKKFSNLGISNLETPQGLLAKDIAYASEDVMKESLLTYLNNNKASKLGLLTKDTLAMAYGMLSTRIGVDNMLAVGHARRLGIQARIADIQKDLINYFDGKKELPEYLQKYRLDDKLMLLGLNERQVVSTIGSFGNDLHVYDDLEEQLVGKGYDFSSSYAIQQIEGIRPKKIQKYNEALFQQYTGITVGTNGVRTASDIPVYTTQPVGFPSGIYTTDNPKAKLIANEKQKGAKASTLGGFSIYEMPDGKRELYYHPGNISEFEYISAKSGVVPGKYAIPESIDTANKIQKQITRNTSNEMTSTHFQKLEGARDRIAMLTQTQGRQSIVISHAEMLADATSILKNRKAELLNKFREYLPTIDNIDDLTPQELSYMLYKSDSYMYDYLGKKGYKFSQTTQDIIENGINNLKLTIPKYNKALYPMYKFVAENLDFILPAISDTSNLQNTLSKLQKLGDKNQLVQGLVDLLKKNSNQVFKTNDEAIKVAIEQILPEIVQAFNKAKLEGKKAFIAGVELLDDGGNAYYKDILAKNPLRDAIAGEYFTNTIPNEGIDVRRAKARLNLLAKEYKDILASADSVEIKSSRVIALQKQIADEFGYLLPTVNVKGFVASEIHTTLINPASLVPNEQLQKGFDKIFTAISNKIDEAPSRFALGEKVTRILDHGYTTIITSEGVPHVITLDDAILGLMQKNASYVENTRLLSMLDSGNIGQLPLEQKRSIYSMLQKQHYGNIKIKWNRIQNMSDVMVMLDERNALFQLVPHTMYNGNVIEIPLGLDNIISQIDDKGNRLLSDKAQQEVLMTWKSKSSSKNFTPIAGEPDERFYDALNELSKNGNINVLFGGTGYEQELLGVKQYLDELDKGTDARKALNDYGIDMVSVNGVFEPDVRRNIVDIDSYDIKADWNDDVYNKSFNQQPTPTNTFTPTNC